MRKFMLLVVFVSTTILFAPPTAVAQTKLGIAAGVFQPFDGETGFSIIGQGLFPVGKNWDFGAELEYRDFKAEILDVDDVGIRTVAVRGLARYTLSLGNLRPYVGAGVGVNFNIIDDDKVEEGNSNAFTTASVNGFGSGIGVLGLGGFDIPITENLFLFGEFRAGYDLQLTDSDDIEAENLGGYSGHGGIRFLF